MGTFHPFIPNVTQPLLWAVHCPDEMKGLMQLSEGPGKSSTQCPEQFVSLPQGHSLKPWKPSICFIAVFSMSIKGNSWCFIWKSNLSLWKLLFLVFGKFTVSCPGCVSLVSSSNTRWPSHPGDQRPGKWADVFLMCDFSSWSSLSGLLAAAYLQTDFPGWIGHIFFFFSYFCLFTILSGKAS